jgi:hypothetical protein
MSWEPVNLAHAGDRPPLKPDLGGVGLVYPRLRHVFSGPQESVKTLAAYVIALEVVRQSQTVVLVDLEMGPWDAHDRFRDLGATDEDFDRILYVEPDTPATDEAIGRLIEADPGLVVIDAAAGAYSLEGLDDNKRADVERFAGIYMRAFWLAGIATILIDHVVKNADNRGKYAIGSERKTGGVDVHLGFEIVSPFVRGGVGLAQIVTHKDRHGWLARPRAAELELRSHHETHAITWEFSTPATEDRTTFRPTELMERISRHLELQTEPISRNAVERDVIGKGKYVRMALNDLVAERYVSETPSANKSRLVESIKPFRAAECVPGASREDEPGCVPSASRLESHNGAVPSVRPECVPGASLALGASASPDASSPTGGRTGRDAPDDPVQDELDYYRAVVAEAR